MFCQKCGCQNAESVSYCQNCGAPLGAQSAQQNAGYQQNVGYQQNAGYQQNVGYQQPRPAKAPQGPLSSHPVLNEIKTLASSPLFLVCAIAYSAALLFNLINTVGGTNSLMRYIYRVASMMDMDYYLYDYLDFSAISGVSMVSAVIGLIPVILITVGLWLTFASAVDRRSNGMKTVGLTIIKVITIISLVCTIISLVAIVIIGIVIAVMISKHMSDVVPYIIGVVIGSAIVLALTILYYAKSVGTINTIKGAITTGRPDDKVSAFVAVLNFISGGVIVISNIVNLFTGGVLLALANLCSAAAVIAFGICIFSYRKKMRVLMAGNISSGQGAQPQEYGAQQYGAQPAYQDPVQQDYGAQQYGAQPAYQQPGDPDYGECTYRENIESIYRDPGDFGGTSALDQGFADVGTTVLNSTPAARVLPHLVRVKDNGMVYVTSQVFRIGKDPNNSDYCITDNPAISRRHAEIVCRNGEYFIVDKNSTNHVYINGGMIPSEVEIKLSDGMEVSLANERFLFQMH